MTTPGELNKITKSVIQTVADLLSREGNEALSAEDLAEELANALVSSVVSSYEEIQTQSYNLVVLGHFRLEDDQSYVAAVGPLSTRAPQRARGMGEGFAWDYRTRRGTGKYALVPLVRNPHEAWDEARASQVREVIDLSRAEREDPSYYATGKPYERGITCICGVKSERERLFICPRHPEGRSNDQQGSP